MFICWGLVRYEFFGPEIIIYLETLRCGLIAYFLLWRHSKPISVPLYAARYSFHPLRRGELIGSSLCLQRYDVPQRYFMIDVCSHFLGERHKLTCFLFMYFKKLLLTHITIFSSSLSWSLLCCFYMTGSLIFLKILSPIFYILFLFSLEDVTLSLSLCIRVLISAHHVVNS